MIDSATRLASLLAAFAAALLLAPVAAQAAPVDMNGLYEQLADPDNPHWDRAESDILREWSKSGSPTMDLLLKRGREAIEAGDTTAAVEHLTALTDHAPDFAEGWYARAMAYYRAGLYGPSLADLRRVLDLNPHQDNVRQALERLEKDAEGVEM